MKVEITSPYNEDFSTRISASGSSIEIIASKFTNIGKSDAEMSSFSWKLSPREIKVLAAVISNVELGEVKNAQA